MAMHFRHRLSEHRAPVRQEPMQPVRTPMRAAQRRHQVIAYLLFAVLCLAVTLLTLKFL
jgi:hypothetical protein